MLRKTNVLRYVKLVKKNKCFKVCDISMLRKTNVYL